MQLNVFFEKVKFKLLTVVIKQRIIRTTYGEMVEWFKAPVLKTGRVCSPPKVQISISPLIIL